MSVRIQLRRDTAANWTATNPTLTQGEPGYETDTGKIKYGDGTTAWNSLAYAPAAAIVDGTIVNADVNASAAIAGTKISPNFGSQTIQTTGVFSHALGTAGAPTITFTGDTNTGIYSPGADQLALTTNGTGRLFISSTGPVSIGSSSTLSYPLTVVASGASVLGIHRTIAGGEARLDFLNNNSSGTAFGAARIGALLTTTTAGAEAGALLFSTANAGVVGEKLRITSTGTLNLVGAGTAGSTQAVSFNGSAPVNSLVIDSSGRLLVGTSSASDSNALLKVQGNIGGSTGAGWLEIRRGSIPGATNSQLALLSFADSSGNPYAYIEGYTDATPGTGDYPGRLVFSTTSDGAPSPTERMRITNKGVVKATNTGDYYAVSGDVHELRTGTSAENLAIFSHTGASPYGPYFHHSTDSNNTTNYFFTCVGNATIRATLRSNGGLANYQSNNVDLSDERTKRDIAPALSTWNCVQAWEVVNYNYIDDAADDASRVGVIAQQVQQHCPEVVIPYQEAEDAVLDEDGNVVTPAKEERLGVREQQMMWMAIKALQEAQVRIESLEAEVAALKAQ